MNAHTASPRPALQIPGLIKRNITLFALSQTFTGAGMQFAYGLGPLMVLSMTGSAGLAGLSVALIGISRFLVAYPVGKITDAYGRKPGILLGLVLAMAGALVVGSSLSFGGTTAFVIGLLLFGMGMNAAQQLRVAATDMFPPQFRGQALGYVALGSLVGLLVSPAVVAWADFYARATGHEPLALPWLVLPVLIVPGMIMIAFVRPDPKEIGMNLATYYPGYTPPVRQREAPREKFRPISLFQRKVTLHAIVANGAAQGNMSIVMVLTSLILSSYGFSLSAIGVSHVFHSAGMFAFTIPLGKLADRFGRANVMYPGIAVSLAGAVLVTFTSGYALITLGTFLVGIGWAAANVAATALIADNSRTSERGRSIGVNDSIAGGVTVVTALATGPLIAWFGLAGAGVAAIVLAVIPFALLALDRGRA